MDTKQLEAKQASVRAYVEAEGYQLLSEYVNSKTSLELICPNGHSRRCSYKSFKSGGCKKCIDVAKLIELTTEIEELGYTFISPPTHAKEVVRAYCKNGHIREAKIHNFRIHGCPMCTDTNVKKDIDFCKSVFTERGFTLLEDEYVNCKTFMRYICTCGQERRTTLDTVLHSTIDSCKICKGKKFHGELSPFWKGGVTPEPLLMRGRVEYRTWRTAVLTRDEYTCQCCGATDKLRAHHIIGWASDRSLGYTVTNGITLCNQCHDPAHPGAFHNLYGTWNNTREQLEEYLTSHATPELLAKYKAMQHKM